MEDIDLDAPKPDPLALEVVTQSYVAPPTDITLWGASTPAQIIEKAAEAATALAAVVDKQGLFTNIQGRKHVRVEGWTLLGSILGVFPVCVWTRPVMKGEEQIGWEARVEAHRNGQVVGAADAQCLRSESLWKTRDDYALRSMAQTRATSKALRMPLGFVVSLAGYATTPAEEMDGIAISEAPRGSQAAPTADEAHRRGGAYEVAGSWHPDVRPPLSPETQELMDQAKLNRAKAAESITSTPEGRQRLKDAGFRVSEPEGERGEKCKKCGGDMGENKDGTVIQCLAGKEEWFALQRAGKSPAEASSLTKGHSYRRVKK